MQINEMLVAVGVPVGTMAMAAVIIAVVGYFKNQERKQRHETIRLALEKGQPLPAELLDSELSVLSRSFGAAARQGDLARGIQWIFAGAGLSLFLWIFKPERPLWAVGLVVLFVGVGKLVSHAVTSRQPTTPPGGPATR
jgi:Domain of unknown function (DUF6249)